MKIAVAVLFGLAVTSSGGAIFFTNQATFTSTFPSLVTINFNGLAPVDGTTFFGNTLTTGGVTFQDEANNLQVVDPGFINAGYNGWSLFGVPVLNDNYGYANSPSAIVVQFSTGVLAAGITISMQPNPGSGGGTVETTATGTVTLSDGESTTFSLDSSIEGFIGFSSASGMTSFTVTAPAFGLITSELLDSSVPEPASWTYFIVGLVMFSGRLFARRSPALTGPMSGKLQN
jgi:hypothetical protein